MTINLISCSNEPPAEKALQQEASSDPIPPKTKKESLDFMSLFAIAEQEELALYNARELELLQPNSNRNSELQKFITSLLSPLEEGVKRRILDGRKNGLLGSKNISYYIVVDTNLPDDSIEGDIRFFEFRRIENTWLLSAVSSVWRCYQGRGHVNYSTQPCL